MKILLLIAVVLAGLSVLIKRDAVANWCLLGAFCVLGYLILGWLPV